MINLYSDTQTLPTPEMRRAIAEAPVGDEQQHRDPSVNALCDRAATLLGKEAAVFLPSGTMCNEIALQVHCRPGDEVIADRTAHLIVLEAGGPAAWSGASVYPVDGRAGVYSAAQARAAIRPRNRYMPRSTLIAVEQSANLGGGTVWQVEEIDALAALATEHGLRMHMDGARLLNAVVASGVEARRFAAPFDSVWIDLSKGLGCPVGAVLAGSAAFIEEAWRIKQRMGGAMRQAGIVAAAGLYALDHHVERLAEDHENARRFAHGIAAVPGIEVDPGRVETNIVLFRLSDSAASAAAFAARLEEAGLRISVLGETLRAVTHLDVSRGDIDAAIAIVADAMP